MTIAIHLVFCTLDESFLFALLVAAYKEYLASPIASGLESAHYNRSVHKKLVNPRGRIRAYLNSLPNALPNAILNALPSALLNTP